MGRQGQEDKYREMEVSIGKQGSVRKQEESHNHKWTSRSHISSIYKPEDIGSIIIQGLKSLVQYIRVQKTGRFPNLEEQQPRKLFMPFSAETTAYPNLASSQISLLPVSSARSNARWKFSFPSSKFFLVLEIMPSLRHPSISPRSSLSSPDSLRYFSTKILILSLFSERSLVPIFPMFPMATDCPLMLLIWIEYFSPFWKWKTLFLLSPNLSQHSPRLIEARNLPLTSARLSWREWYSMAFLTSS